MQPITYFLTSILMKFFYISIRHRPSKKNWRGNRKWNRNVVMKIFHQRLTKQKKKDWLWQAYSQNFGQNISWMNCKCRSSHCKCRNCKCRSSTEKTNTIALILWRISSRFTNKNKKKRTFEIKRFAYKKKLCRNQH